MTVGEMKTLCAICGKPMTPPKDAAPGSLRATQHLGMCVRPK